MAAQGFLVPGALAPPLPLEVGPLNPAGGLGSAVSSPVGSGAKPQPPTILLHFEDLEILLMTSEMCIVLCLSLIHI